MFTLSRGLCKGKKSKNFITEKSWRPAFAVSPRLYGPFLAVQCTTSGIWVMPVSLSGYMMLLGRIQIGAFLFIQQEKLFPVS